MKRVQYGDLNFWHFDNLSQFPSVRHFVSERILAGDKEFTLSLSSSPDRNFVLANRQKVADAMGIAPEKLVMPSQVHKTRIVNVTSHTTKDELQETDALITAEKGICIAVMSADCVPILLYDKKNNVCGAVHSGWKGTVAKILEKTLHAMSESFGTRGENVIAGIGPSVSQQSYEVGAEVVEAVRQSFSNANDLLIPLPASKARLNLWDANKVQLQEFGVPEAQIEISDLCTVLNNNYFFSARKGDSGRFAAGILLT
ncbi:MAG TPA: peptidoglycan editing factor PgeF [Chryseosolibacter sp.]